MQKTGANKVKVWSIVFWSLFGLLSTLTLVESCFPSSASGLQSMSLSSLFAKIINAISPSKEAVEAKPSELTLTPNITKATLEDGTKVSLFDGDEAIVGTTKMFTYTLAYPTDPKPDIYDSSVNLEFVKTPGEGSYSHTLTTSRNGGALRIIPNQAGDFVFSISDNGGHKETFSFTAKKEIAPKEIKTNVATLDLKVGQAYLYPYAMSLGDLTRTDGSVDHYLARCYDRGLVEFTSSNPEVFSVNNGVLLGKSNGSASLLFKGKAVCTVNVAGTYASPVASIALTADKSVLSPLDYDYGYGAQINVKYLDSLGDEIESDEPVLFSSSNPLIAKVDNDHLEVDDSGKLVPVKGGFVSGYRTKGYANITATLASNPFISASTSFESKEVLPTGVEFKVTSEGNVLPLSGGSIQAGNTLTVASNFEPKNASSTKIHVDVSDPTKLTVINNDTNNPSISLLYDGNVSFTIYASSLGKSSGVTYSLTVTPRPQIAGDDMKDFHAVFRKAAGHFTLFLVTGLFGSLAMYLSLFKDKKHRIWIIMGILLVAGFALAGVSEAIQAIPALQRGPSWTDVGIDTMGFAVSAVLVGAVFLIVDLAKRRKKGQEEPIGEAPADNS